jgi:predicted membrane-bound dolichyl-phosphate-mannose-protein mannosyltransferase
VTAFFVAMSVLLGIVGIALDRTSISGVSITLATLAVMSAHLDAARLEHLDRARRHRVSP